MVFLMVLSEGGQSLVARIYDEHYERMLYVASQILGEHRAEDAVNDAFVKLITKFEKNIEALGDKPARFFVIVIRNYSLDMQRREHMKTEPFDDELIDIEFPQTNTMNPEVSLLNNESIERLAGIIRKLPLGLRQALEYRFIDGYSNKEVATMLGISQSAVSTRIDKAKKRLRELLESEVSVNVN